MYLKWFSFHLVTFELCLTIDKEMAAYCYNNIWKKIGQFDNQLVGAECIG